MTERMLALLFAGPLVFLATFAGGRWLKRHAGVRLGIMYQLFCVALAVYLPAEWLRIDLPYSEHFAPVVEILGVFFIIALIRRFVLEMYFQERRGIAIPKFFSQLAGWIIFFAVFLLILWRRYDVTVPPSLLTGSGIAAVIIGLAMQDLMSNIISGFVLQFGKPFQIGDWLILDQRHAEVIEMNWRSTRLRTNDDICLDVPNNQIAKQTIINLSHPTRLHAMRLQVSIDYAAPPNLVKDALAQAAAHATGVLAKPGIKVFTNQFGESAIVYEIKFWMDDHSRYNEIVDGIRTNVWYELQRRRIKIPFPIRTLQIQRPARPAEQEQHTAALAALHRQQLFQCLDQTQLETLLANAKLERFGRDEKLIEQGHSGDSMFILVKGQASVTVERNGEPTRVALLENRDCFGEMSLLTGEKRSATVTAQTDCEVLEIEKPVLGEILQGRPELLQQLSELLAQRRMETEGILAENAQKQTLIAKRLEYSANFLAKLRDFFEL
ncbi:MAG: mechanosensitive ion channel family protein [Verrucomicrobia bacterium]|nr:mechanosensitive ion channel family protein [Verrucomicrobiota bacterium]